MIPLDPVAGAIVCGGCAWLFGFAAVHKLRSPAQFAGTLSGYRVLPAFLSAPASVLLPILEGLTALGLLLGRTREAASLLGCGLLVAYAAAMGVNLLRGRRHLDCGCLGAHQRGRISGALVWRNLLLAPVLAAAGCSRWGVRPWNWLDIGTTFVAVCAFALLYTAANGLLALQARHEARGG